MAKFSLGNILAEQEARAPAQAERTIEVITSEILEAKRVGGEAVLAIGRGLIEAKGLLSHGEWLPWLSEKVEFSERSAQNFMRLAREWSNPQTLADLGASKALALLALPESEREDFISETHTVDGEEKTVIDMSARQLETAIREREEALAEKNAAEQACAKMVEDMALTKQLLELAQAERDTALQEAQERQTLFRASELETARLAKELEELKARPVEVAAEVDQAALDQARNQAVAEMQATLDKAREESAKADEKLKQAEAALVEAEAKLEAAAKAERQAAIAGNKELASFEAYFNQAQEIVNKMRGLLLKVRGKGDESAGGMEQALRALGELVGRAAE